MLSKSAAIVRITSIADDSSLLFFKSFLIYLRYIVLLQSANRFCMINQQR